MGSGFARIVTRFAPSPTGYLHLGHAYSALLNFEQALAAGGRFILRIEDIDRARCRAEYTEAIFEDLTWLGLSWEEPVLRQWERLEYYTTRLDELRGRGLVHRCFKSRQDIEHAMGAPHAAPASGFAGDAISPLEEREKLASGLPYAWRLSLSAAESTLGAAFANLSFLELTPGGLVKRAAEPRRFGGAVLGRKDIGTSYHLASVLDDAAQGVTHVTRGEDLREVAGLHALLYALFGFEPPVYRHHPLLTDAGGQRLSKRAGSLTLREMRQAGMTAQELRSKLPPMDVP